MKTDNLTASSFRAVAHPVYFLFGELHLLGICGRH